MFYDRNDCAYKILGVYHVHRKQRNVMNPGRNHIAFSYRIRGSSTFSFDGQSLYAGDGSTVFLPEGVSFRNQNEGPEEMLVVHLRSLGTPPDTIRVFPDTQMLESLFRKLLDAWESGSYNRSMEALYGIFAALEAPSVLPPVIAPGVALLRRSFKDPRLTVAQAAKACFVSEVYFRRIYRQHFGVSPLQDILRLRFAHAAQLLRSGYYSVDEVSRMSGFTDVKYFRTAFTKHFGTTPTRYKSGKPL